MISNFVKLDFSRDYNRMQSKKNLTLPGFLDKGIPKHYHFNLKDGTMLRNIFIEKNVICPACKAGISMKYPNPKLYAAAGRDEDQRVTSYSWAGGIETDVLPHYYAVFQCPNCLLADMKESFETHGHGVKEKALHDAIQNSPFEKRMLLRKLRRFVPQGDINWQGAVALHLAAIYARLLPGEKNNA